MLVGVTRLVAYPLTVGSGVVDALDAVLMMLALVNLRLAWTGANASGGGRARRGSSWRASSRRA